MSRRQAIGWSMVAWIAVGTCWLVATHNFHPSWTLAFITTGSLIVAYAAAAYVNHLALIPGYLQVGRYWEYALGLLTTMALLTALALAIIRISYFNLWGPDGDPNGAYKHFGIDFFGMAIHLLGAAGVVWMVGKFMRRDSRCD